MGDAWAQCNLAVAYLEGAGTEKNEHEGFKWLRQSARKGDSKAQYNLGIEYLDGNLTGRSIKNAKIWLMKSSGQGNADAKELLKTLY